MSISNQNLTNSVKAKINKRFDSLYTVTPLGNCEPYVCIICDEFLDPDHNVLLSKDLLRRVLLF